MLVSGERRGRENWVLVTIRRQKPGNGRADQESDAERHADYAERFGAILGLGDIGDIGLRQREIARGQTVNDPREENHP